MIFSEILWSYYSVWILLDFYLTPLRQKFCENNDFTKHSVEHSVVISVIYSHRKNISSNHIIESISRAEYFSLHFKKCWNACYFWIRNNIDFSKKKLTLRQILTFSWSRSKANWRPTAFMSVLCRAEVMYMCISRKWPITPSCSDCSISNWDRSLTNHSNDFWSRLIQKKSTLKH